MQMSSLFSRINNSVDNFLILLKDKYMKKIQTTLITAITFVLICSTSWASTYYINGANGNDANPGSPSAPWKTIGKANNTLKAGDTVYIKKGTYKETIHPSCSGEKGSYITYARDGSDEVIITGISGPGANLENRKYIIVDGINIINIGGHWIDMQPNSYHIIIKNCHMEESDKYAGIMIDGGAYNKILNNTLIGRCGPENLITLWNSSYNLVEGNKMYYGPHNALTVHDRIPGTTSFNIIKNNFIQNRWHSNLAISGVEYILVENNTIVDAGEDAADSPCGPTKTKTDPRYVHKGIQLSSTYGIVRNNVIVNNGYGIGLTSAASSTTYSWKNNCTNNRIYNNTLSQNYYGIRHNSSDPATDNVIKNNIVYNSKIYNVKVLSIDKNYFINNNIIGAKVEYSPRDIIEDNISFDPLFININTRDFRPQENLNTTNKGSFLTKTVNPGSGNTIKVEDARYFMDGWGVIEGDLIQIEGQAQTAMITSVDYKTNTITIDTRLSWDAGKGVSLPFQGTFPEIGAFEIKEESSSAILLPPYNLRVSNK